MAAATVERDQTATPSELSPVVRAMLKRASDAKAYARSQAQVAQTGYCSHPVRLAGTVEAADPATGELRTTYSTETEPDGTLLVACGNRRASHCPSCSETYRRDAFHLVRAGLAGGKGLPETVAAHPRVFATFTAPSFGQVHARRARGGTVYPCHPARLGERCPHGRGLACWHKHDEGDARLGEPICPGCYDTQTQALWNAAAPELWRRTTITLRRVLARELGLTSEAFVRRVRVAYVKVAEYQARGAVHFHGVFRLDGRDPTDPTAVLPPPDGASVDLLERAIREAAERARVLVPAFADVPTRAARWGPQLDLRVIRPTGEAVRTRRSCRPSGSPATSPNTRPRARKALALLWTGASTTARPLRPLHRTRRGRLPGRCPHRRGHHRAAATAARPSLWSAAGAVAPASQGVEMTDRTSDGGRQGKRKGRRMFGTVRKLPSGRWQARYWDDKGRRQTAPHTFLTKADAARYLALVEADLTRGLFHDPRRGAIPFGEWADRWMDNAELRPTTRDLYGYLLRRFIKPTFEAVTLAEIDDVMVEDWLANLRTRPKLSRSTIAKAYRLLARILGAAVKQRYILHTTWRIEGAGKEHAAEMRCASPEQINALADAVAPRYRALVLVAGYGGLRWGEAGLRSVALPRFVVGALKEHLATWAEPGAAGLVFPAAEGGWMRRSNFRRRVWLPATKAVGVEGLRFHDLRHSAATLAAAAGATTKELMARIGHSTHEAAIRYQHVMDGRDAAIAEALGALGGRVVSIHSAKSKRGMGWRAEGTQRARAKRGERTGEQGRAADQRESRSGRRDLNPRPPAPKVARHLRCADQRKRWSLVSGNPPVRVSRSAKKLPDTTHAPWPLSTCYPKHIKPITSNDAPNATHISRPPDLTLTALTFAFPSSPPEYHRI